MAQANPFADLIPQQGQGQPPARIYGGPKTVDPMEQARFGLAVNSDARADRAAERADAASLRQAAAAERQAEVDARKLTETARLTENEGKTTAFYNRALGANRDFEKSGVATDPRGYLEQTAVNVLPEGITNAFASPERQKAEQAKRDFIAASLRYESGAAISPAEFEKQEKTFFPQPNDGQEVIAQKARARQRIIESFGIGAGRGADEVEALRGGSVQFNDQAPQQRSDAVNLTPEQKSAFQALAQSGASPEAMQAMARGFGLKASDADLQGLAQFYAKPENRTVAPDVNVNNDVQAVNPGDGATGAFARGVANTGSLGFVNRIGAIADAVGGEDYGQALDRRRGYDAYDEQNNGLARGVGQFAGGFAIPLVGSASAANLARNGGAAGALYGLGNSYGDAGSRALETLGGGVAGAALGYGLGRGAQYLAGRGGGVPPPPNGGGVNQGVVDAAERQGIDIVSPDAKPGRRSLYGVLESLPFSGGRIRDDLARGAGQIEQRVADIGGGAAVPRNDAAETIRTAGQRYVDRSRTVVNRLYDRAASLAGNAKVTPQTALNSIDQHIAELSETPSANGSKLDILNQIRADLVDDQGNVKALSIQALRDLRTAARDEIGVKGLRYTDTERRINDAIASASQDIRAQLSGSALRAFDRADRSYRERADLVDNVVEKFIGNDRSNPRSSEKIFSSVENAALPRSGDAANLSRMMERLEPQERQQVASTIAATLGRRAEGADNAFTPDLFFSQIQKFSPEARTAIFGQQGAKDLADLATIAQGRIGTTGRLNNTRSGQVSNWFNAVKSVLAGGGVGGGLGAATGVGAATGGVAGAVGIPSVLGAGYVTARALGNPRFVSTMAQAARATTPAAQVRVVRMLGQIATRQPEIANDILPIQQSLQASLPRAAAEDQKQKRR